MFSKAGMMMFPGRQARSTAARPTTIIRRRAPSCSCVYEGLQLPIDAALRVESRYFTQDPALKEAAAMIRSLFLSMQELNKGARRPQNVPPTKVKKLAVIGAGFMGASVGYVSARAGLDVVLIDRDQESADKGKAPRQKRDRRPGRQGPRQGGRSRRASCRASRATADYARVEGLRPRHRGRVRGPQGQGGHLRQGAGTI